MWRIPFKYKHIEDSFLALKEKCCDVIHTKLLMYLRSVAISTQINVFSEIDYSTEANAILRAQEYVQSIIIPLNRMKWCFQMMKKKNISQIITEFKMYIMSFDYFIIIGSTYSKRQKYLMNASKEIVEAQYMYWCEATVIRYLN